jgi:hypothetical protein
VLGVGRFEGHGDPRGAVRALQRFAAVVALAGGVGSACRASNPAYRSPRAEAGGDSVRAALGLDTGSALAAPADARVFVPDTLADAAVMIAPDARSLDAAPVFDVAPAGLLDGAFPDRLTPPGVDARVDAPVLADVARQLDLATPSDAAAADLGPVVLLDAAFADVPADASADVAIDAGSEGAPDISVDGPADVAPDAALDAWVDATPDARMDAAPLGCSVASDVAATLVFTNNFTNRSVVTFWINYQCQEQRYRTLAPGESYSQGTYVTHPWRVRDTNGALVKDVPASTVGGTRAVPIP